MILNVFTGALLSVIAFAEGTHERYDITFDYHKILTLRDHPGVVIRSRKYYSSASGRYQFLLRTWRGLQENCNKNRFDLTNFYPANQDDGAVCLMEFEGVFTHDEDLSRDLFETAILKLNKQWASLPGSPYGQPTRDMDDLWTKYREEIATEKGKKDHEEANNSTRISD